MGLNGGSIYVAVVSSSPEIYIVLSLGWFWSSRMFLENVPWWFYLLENVCLWPAYLKDTVVRYRCLLVSYFLSLSTFHFALLISLHYILHVIYVLVFILLVFQYCFLFLRGVFSKLRGVAGQGWRVWWWVTNFSFFNQFCLF